ncbi:hypothetical protein HPP92_001667 [Vanilla planifolia]|uniref:Uncharacterized protein n=1 Tax=Vanilla planifolia TaxID=51239 RepID=A0A835VHR7_VANPL|nr:hypothetical protein HPP92_001667 [Vanilla planifolia]
MGNPTVRRIINLVDQFYGALWLNPSLIATTSQYAKLISSNQTVHKNPAGERKWKTERVSFFSHTSRWHRPVIAVHFSRDNALSDGFDSLSAQDL